jgi:hypothetical protein
MPLDRHAFLIKGKTWSAEHCFGNKTIPTRVTTTRTENGHRQDTKQALEYRPKGKRNIGRQRKRWKDQFHLEG